MDSLNLYIQAVYPEQPERISIHAFGLSPKQKFRRYCFLSETMDHLGDDRDILYISQAHPCWTGAQLKREWPQKVLIGAWKPHTAK